MSSDPVEPVSVTDPAAELDSGTAKTTWVVLCTPAAGKPFPEYVEGTKLVRDAIAGMITIFDGDHVVRRYTAGAWSNFAEWVSFTTDFFSRDVIRRGAAETDGDATERSPQRAMANAMAKGADDAVELVRRLTRPQRTATPRTGTPRTGTPRSKT